MKKLSFVKMHGTWNDFVVLYENDIRDAWIDVNVDFIQKICNRNFWVGSDGLLVVSKSEVADFKYNMYNPDGSEAEMCGNGIRCYMKYLLDNNLTDKNELVVETLIWNLDVSYNDGLFTVQMGQPGKIPNLSYDNKKLGDRFPIKSADRDFVFIPVSMGNPHAVIFLQDTKLEDFDLEKYWKPIETDTEVFPNRTNVEFISVVSETEIDMRVWERGAGETLACGTWACASVVAWVLSGRLKADEFVQVNLKWGTLWVSWSGDEKDTVVMKWWAETTFEWMYYLS